MIETFHKPEDVAPQVGMSLQAFYSACRQNQFPHVRIGKRIRVPQSMLEKWLTDQTSKYTKAQNQGNSLAASA